MNLFRDMLAIAGKLSLFSFLATPLAAQMVWHTTPDKWKEPRKFHTRFERRYDERIVISREKLMPQPTRKVLSPNKAYWFTVNPDFEPNPATPSLYSFHNDPDVPIYVFHERDYLIKILLRDRYPNFVLDIRWVNEKLLFIQVSWGRVLGTCFLFDVEREEIIYKEMVNDGVIPFQQWRSP